MTEDTVIHVLNKAVMLKQPAKGFRTCVDSVLLAAACPAEAGERVLDIGCGVGGAGLCLFHRVPGLYITGIDIQADHLDLAQHNAQANNAADHFSFVHDDIRQYKTEAVFDHVICNPPYLANETHLQSPHTPKALAHGSDTSIKDWIDCAYRCLKPGGSLTLIHRADHVDKILLAMGPRFGAITMIPLWPKRNRPAKRCLVRALKDRKSPAHIHPGLTLHREDGTYTDEADRILKHAGALL